MPASPVRDKARKKGQAIPVAPLQPPTLAVFRPWGIQRELVAGDLPQRQSYEEILPCATFAVMKNVNPLLWQHAALASALLVVLLLTGYLMGPSVMVSTPMSVGQLGVVLIAMLLLGLAVRKSEDGVLSYKRAFGHVMLVAVVAIFASGVFSIVLYEFIAPAEFVEAMIRTVKEKTLDSMASFGAPSAMIEEVESTLDAELRKGFSTAGLLQGLLWNALLWAIPALLVALVVRRKPDAAF